MQTWSKVVHEIRFPTHAPVAAFSLPFLLPMPSFVTVTYPVAWVDRVLMLERILQPHAETTHHGPHGYRTRRMYTPYVIVNNEPPTHLPRILKHTVVAASLPQMLHIGSPCRKPHKGLCIHRQQKQGQGCSLMGLTVPWGLHLTSVQRVQYFLEVGR